VGDVAGEGGFELGPVHAEVVEVVAVLAVVALRPGGEVGRHPVGQPVGPREAERVVDRADRLHRALEEVDVAPVRHRPGEGPVDERVEAAPEEVDVVAAEGEVVDVVAEDPPQVGHQAGRRCQHLQRVAVAGGRIDGLDATGADLRDVSLSGVSLAGVILDGARCERVDLTGADITPVHDVADLSGTTISAAQAVTLADRLARGLGIAVVAPGTPD